MIAPGQLLLSGRTYSSSTSDRLAGSGRPIIAAVVCTPLGCLGGRESWSSSLLTYLTDRHNTHTFCSSFRSHRGRGETDSTAAIVDRRSSTAAASADPRPSRPFVWPPYPEKDISHVDQALVAAALSIDRLMIMQK
jgi:hypothetical protein